jgi:hypothetical protein
MRIASTWRDRLAKFFLATVPYAHSYEEQFHEWKTIWGSNRVTLTVKYLPGSLPITFKKEHGTRTISRRWPNCPTTDSSSGAPWLPTTKWSRAPPTSVPTSCSAKDGIGSKSASGRRRTISAPRPVPHSWRSSGSGGWLKHKLNASDFIRRWGPTHPGVPRCVRSRPKSANSSGTGGVARAAPSLPYPYGKAGACVLASLNQYRRIA